MLPLAFAVLLLVGVPVALYLSNVFAQLLWHEDTNRIASILFGAVAGLAVALITFRDFMRGLGPPRKP